MYTINPKIFNYTCVHTEKYILYLNINYLFYVFHKLNLSQTLNVKYILKKKSSNKFNTSINIIH